MGIGIDELRFQPMTTWRRVVVALLVYGSILFVQPACADVTIVIVRHGEKPAQGLGQLSCQGLNRALALPRVLLSRYGDPVAIYAPNPAVQKLDKGVPYAYVRPLATIERLARFGAAQLDDRARIGFGAERRHTHRCMGTPLC